MVTLPRPFVLPEFLRNLFTPAKELMSSHPDGTCNLSVGAPVDPTPQFIRDTLVEASDVYGCPSVIGTRQLREVILTWGARRRMTDAGVEGVIPTIGSEEAAAWLPTLLGIHPDDTALAPEVACPTYDISARLIGAIPVPVDPTRSDTWPDAALVFLNSLGDPDDHVLSTPQLRATLA